LAVGLLIPQIFGILTGNPDFNPDLQMRLIMGISGSLMTGWTFLLLWAVKQPVDRRFIILLTAFPVVFGLLILALIGFIEGNTSNIWILIKCSILFISMVTSYIYADKMAKEKE
jgi:general stress protein CsbA